MADTISFDITLRQICFGVATENKFALIGENYLTLAGVQELADEFVEQVVQPLNVIQHTGVTNVSLILTQRGDTIYTAEVPVSAGGSSGATGGESLPAKFPFLVRLYTGLTFAVQDSVPQTAHPIHRGMQYISGADDRYFVNGIFQGSLPEVTGWSDYLGALTNSFVLSSNTYTPAVLSEAVTTPPSPWTRPVSIASITGASLRTVTKLSSRES